MPDVPAGRALVEERLAGGDGWLEPEGITRLLAAYGIPMCPQSTVRTLQDATRQADLFGYPVAQKLAGKAVHKSDVEGVRVGLRNDSELAVAFAGLRRYWG